jgi:hypothetical protein
VLFVTFDDTPSFVSDIDHLCSPFCLDQSSLELINFVDLFKEPTFDSVDFFLLFALFH